MVQQVLSSSHGPIQPDVWATMTASRICIIYDERNVAAVGLRNEIAKRLVLPFKEAQLAERDSLSQKGRQHLEEELDPLPYADEALKVVVDAARATQWEEHFQKEIVQSAIRSEIATQIATVQNIERQWYITNKPVWER